MDNKFAQIRQQLSDLEQQLQLTAEQT